MNRALSPDVLRQMCDHMNDDHADSLAHYARVFGGCTDASRAKLLELTAVDMELEVQTAAAPIRKRIPFDHRLEDAEDARATLVAMARAGARAGQT